MVQLIALALAVWGLVDLVVGVGLVVFAVLLIVGGYGRSRVGESDVDWALRVYGGPKRKRS